MHVGEPEIAALETEGQFGVIETEQVEDGGLKVMDVDAILDGVEAKLVRFTKGDTRADPAASEPHRIGINVMVAAHIVAADVADFAHRRSAELAAPDDERVIEQAAPFQIAD
jgi:hypothetical protein